MFTYTNSENIDLPLPILSTFTNDADVVTKLEDKFQCGANNSPDIMNVYEF